jgi:MFS family permease
LGLRGSRSGRHHMLSTGLGSAKTTLAEGCQAYFLISMYAMPSKVLRCTRWLASILPTPGHARFSPRSRLRMGASRNGLGSGRCVRSEAGLPARPGAVRRLLRLDRAVQHRWCGDRWAHDPRCSRACGLSLLSVANTGQAQLRAVSLWGAAAAVRAAAGPILGGVLVEFTGWQGLFWIDAGVALLCMVLTFFTVTESRDPDRPRSIDYAGTVLVALTLAPFILAVSKGSDWGMGVSSNNRLFRCVRRGGIRLCCRRTASPRPLLDLALLRNRVLVGATVAILIGAGTINGLMYLLSLYFQDENTLGFTPLQAGLATLPATVGLVLVAPLVPRLAARFGGHQVIGVGFAVTAGGFAAIGFVQPSWRYLAFLLPLIAVAVGMGLSNGRASSAATAAVSADQVGAASGVPNVARYVGAAVATALAASIYASVTANRTAAGETASEALLRPGTCLVGDGGL